MASSSEVPSTASDDQIQPQISKYNVVKSEGITLLYEPQRQDEDEAVADVVFVHGLQGHPQRTWQCKPPSESPKNTIFHRFSKKQKREAPPLADDVFWPRDLLPLDNDNIVVYTYGYDSKVTKGFTQPASKNSIFEHGNSLLQAVARARSKRTTAHDKDRDVRRPEHYKERRRPIIFVAHSLGGIVVKQALIEARKQHNRDRNLFDVYVSTYAIIFFGTPHRGADLAVWGTMLQQIAEMALLDTNQSILRDLIPSCSSKLFELRLDFNDVLEDTDTRVRRLKMFTFQEELGMTGMRPFGGKVVPDSSSSFESREYGNDHIHANHMNMCRFGDRASDGYEKFQFRLKEYVDDLLEIRRIVAQAEAAAEHARRQDILHRLDFSGRRSRRHQIQQLELLAHSVEWIWSIDAGSRSFTRWLESDSDDIFWIHGKPGSGKSTLMDYLARHPSTKSKLRINGESSCMFMDFFFDFRKTRGLANNLEGFLRSLLLQLLVELPGLPDLSLEKGENTFDAESTSDARTNLDLADLEDETTWTTQRLRAMIERVLHVANISACIFVDGLDEYGGRLSAIVQNLRELVKTSNVKLCIASRPEVMFQEAFGEQPGIRLQDHNGLGIRMYTEGAIVSTFPDLASDSLMIKMVEEIARKANGVFLWAHFAIEEILEGYAARESKAQLLARLKGLPDELEDLYARILNRMGQIGDREGHAMLAVACYATRPLTLQEFMVAIDIQMKRQPPSHISGKSVEDFARRLQAETGGFLEVESLNSESTSKDASRKDNENDRTTTLEQHPGFEMEAFDRYLVGRSTISNEFGTSFTMYPQHSRRNPRRQTSVVLDEGPSGEHVEHQIESAVVVQLIHETVGAYLRRDDAQKICGSVSPQSLLLETCALHLKSILSQSIFRPAQGRSFARWEVQGKTFIPQRLPPSEFPLLEYCATNIFEHARRLEMDGISSYPSLRPHLSPALFTFHVYASNFDVETRVSGGCRSCIDHMLFAFEWHSETHATVALRHGLLLYCKDALAEGIRFEDCGDGILHGALAAACAAISPEILSSKNEHTATDIVRFVVSHGAVLQFTHLIEAFSNNPPSVLEVILEAAARRRIAFYNKERQPVTPLWIYARHVDIYSGKHSTNDLNTKEYKYTQGLLDSSTSRAKLDILLRYASSIDETCGPEGTVLQTLISEFMTTHAQGHVSPGFPFFEKKFNLLVKHGADVRVHNDHVTPIEMLQTAWTKTPLSDTGRSIVQRLLMKHDGWFEFA